MTIEIKEATVQKWHVEEGEEVEDFQTLVDVSTDKLFTEIPSTEAGKIHKIFIGEGEACQVGEVLFQIEVDGDDNAKGSPAPVEETKAPETAQNLSLIHI